MSQRSRGPLRARTGVERELTDRLSCVGFGKWWCEAQEKGDGFRIEDVLRTELIIYLTILLTSSKNSHQEASR